MKIYVKNEDGKMYEASQINETTYSFQTENKTFKLCLSESEIVNDFGDLLEMQKKRVTKAIFLNEDLLEQLRDTRKNKGEILHIILGIK